MTKLEKLYSIIENSRDVGVKLPEDVIRQVEELDENIIKDEILPSLSSDIAPRLEPIKRDLVLVVEYHPGEPISVALRSSTPVKSQVEPPQIEPHEPSKQVTNKTKGLRVTFPDGTVIWHRQAIDTFIDTLRKIGLSRIPQVGISHKGYNLVGKKKRPTEPGRIWQHECDGWLIYSNISNQTKIDHLKQISKVLHLHLKIEEGKPQ